jgi:ribosome assembly protein YihI (activator of Der GTPase)
LKPSSTTGHHTAKPAADPKSKSHWVTTDQSYAGTGSAELTNWARAVCLLSTTKDEGRLRLILAKRGSRAGATSLEGDRTNVIHLKHSDDGILWEQTPLPVVMEKAKKEPKAKAAPKRKPTKKQLSKLRKEAATKEIENLDGLIARITVPMNKKQIQELSEQHGHGSPHLVKKQWSEVELHLVKENGKYTRKPTQ